MLKVMNLVLPSKYPETVIQVNHAPTGLTFALDDDSACCRACTCVTLTGAVHMILE